MIPSTKHFDRGDHVLEIETTVTGERIVRKLEKGQVKQPAKEVRRIPSKMRRAANFAAAAAQHVAAGRPQASDEQVAKRFAICQGCSLFSPISEGQGQCTHPNCGCSLMAVGVSGLNKLRWADQACPIGKWKPVTARTDTA